MPQYLHANPKREITRGTLDAFWNSHAEEWVKFLFIYLYHTGARISEALAVKAEDFDTITRDGEKFVLIYSLTLKNPSTHVRTLHISLDEPYMAELVGYSRFVKEGRLFKVTRQKAWREMQKVIPWVTPHGFRHNRLNQFAQDGETAFALKSWAGWSSVAPSDSYTQSVDTLKMAQRRRKREKT